MGIPEFDAIISEMLAGDVTGFEALPYDQGQQIAQFIVDNRIYPDWSIDPTIGDMHSADKSLPDCGGYFPPPWSWQYELVEYRSTTNGLLYQTGPNCCMVSPGQDCGTDYDDYMLSFAFGRHNESIEQLRSMLKWYSTNYYARTLLNSLHPNGLDVRVYQETPGGGVDNYDVKVCMDDYFYPYFETFLLRKYSN
jgi:hypothetical protein